MTHPESTHDSFRLTVHGPHGLAFVVPAHSAVHRDQLTELFRAKFPASEGFRVQIGQVEVKELSAW